MTGHAFLVNAIEAAAGWLCAVRPERAGYTSGSPHSSVRVGVRDSGASGNTEPPLQDFTTPSAASQCQQSLDRELTPPQAGSCTTARCFAFHSPATSSTQHSSVSSDPSLGSPLSSGQAQCRTHFNSLYVHTTADQPLPKRHGRKKGSVHSLLPAATCKSDCNSCGCSTSCRECEYHVTGSCSSTVTGQTPSAGHRLSSPPRPFSPLRKLQHPLLATPGSSSSVAQVCAQSRLEQLPGEMARQDLQDMLPLTSLESGCSPKAFVNTCWSPMSAQSFLQPSQLFLAPTRSFTAAAVPFPELQAARQAHGAGLLMQAEPEAPQSELSCQRDLAGGAETAMQPEAASAPGNTLFGSAASMDQMFAASWQTLPSNASASLPLPQQLDTKGSASVTSRVSQAELPQQLDTKGPAFVTSGVSQAELQTDQPEVLPVASATAFDFEDNMQSGSCLEMPDEVNELLASLASSSTAVAAASTPCFASDAQCYAATDTHDGTAAATVRQCEQDLAQDDAKIKARNANPVNGKQSAAWGPPASCSSDNTASGTAFGASCGQGPAQHTCSSSDVTTSSVTGHKHMLSHSCRPFSASPSHSICPDIPSRLLSRPFSSAATSPSMTHRCTGHSELPAGVTTTLRPVAKSEFSPEQSQSVSSMFSSEMLVKQQKWVAKQRQLELSENVLQSQQMEDCSCTDSEGSVSSENNLRPSSATRCRRGCLHHCKVSSFHRSLSKHRQFVSCISSLSQFVCDCCMP